MGRVCVELGLVLVIDFDKVSHLLLDLHVLKARLEHLLWVASSGRQNNFALSFDNVFLSFLFCFVS